MRHSYVLNPTALRASSFQSNPPIWQREGKHWLGLALICYLGAVAAGNSGNLVSFRGLYILLIAAPIVFFFTLAYRVYRKRTNATPVTFARDSVSRVRQQVGDVVELQRDHTFRTVFDHAAGMALASPDGRWLKVNPCFCETVGYSEQDLLAGSLQDIAHPDELGSLLMQIHKLLAGKIVRYQAEQRYIHKLGQTVWVLVNVSLIRNAESEPSQLIFQIQNITDRKRAEERLVHHVFHDALTGLPNRALFMDRLKLAAQRARRRKDQIFAVLFIDLDHFKVVNDRLGHMVGDQLLIGIARRMETFVRSTDTIARLGGDEFTILLEDVKDQTEAINIVDRIQKGLSQAFTLGGHEVVTTASIGVALSSAGYDNIEGILRDADTAMYRAKSLGKARHELFDKEMHSQAANLLQLETDLREALEQQELFLQYQPIVSLDTGRLKGFEALVRWQHPKYGLISPLDFIPIAEEKGLIVMVGQWVLAEACRQMREWRDRFPSNLFMGVNISSKQLKHPDLMFEITRSLDEAGLEPSSLNLEITESVVMEDIEAAITSLRQLRALGIGLSIDDFGTGYSSLTYLHRLPVNALKIDRSFVSRLSTNDENRDIVQTIVKLAQNLGMTVVAEGIETMEQLNVLRQLNCEAGQGFLFSKPIYSEAADSLIMHKSQWQETVGVTEKSCRTDVELFSNSYSM